LKIGIGLYVATPLICYLPTPNNFVGLKRDDIAQILIIYLVWCQLWINLSSYNSIKLNFY